jgi:hypothetical protein
MIPKVKGLKDKTNFEKCFFFPFRSSTPFVTALKGMREKQSSTNRNKLDE